ncbi:cation transporter [Massilia sp. TS11]|uniref:cation transporter n=1 Tax=Massilia sp. TS11 TaxID=2908003 RepID=UPI001EDA9EC7|nr:cation transporter [Massilia sp. TS11]MCG2584656.1 heavy-metal-associated domain-containing protein [Massilia sp. TS11]
MKKVFAVLAMSVFSLSALAADKTVVLSVPKMQAEADAAKVNGALKKIPGVSKAQVKLDKRETHVTFDDSKTSTSALLQAAKDIGYAATQVE